jgi:hypothetical protein
VAAKTGPDADILPSATDPVADATPSPPTAGQETALAQPREENHVAGPAQPAPKLAQLAKGQQVGPVPTSPIPAFDFTHPNFDLGQFSQHFTNAVSTFKDVLGVNPALSVAHDLTRSGLNTDAIRDVANHINATAANVGRQLDFGELTSHLGQIAGEHLGQFRQFPTFEVPNAPWQGIKWDEVGKRFLANLTELGPVADLKREIEKSGVPVDAAVAYLNDVRSKNASVLSAAMPDIQKGNWGEAAAKVRDQLGQNILSITKPIDQKIIQPLEAGAAQAVQDTLMSGAHAFLETGAALADITHGHEFDQAAWDKAKAKGDIFGMVDAITPVRALSSGVAFISTPFNVVSNFFEDGARNMGAPPEVVQAAKYFGQVLTIVGTGGTKALSGLTARGLAVKGGIGLLGAEHTAANEDPNAPTYQKILDPILSGWQSATIAPKSLTGLTKPELAAKQAAIEHFRVSHEEAVRAAMDDKIRVELDKHAPLAADAEAKAQVLQQAHDKLETAQSKTIGAQESPEEHQAQIVRNEQANNLMQQSIEAQEARLRADTPAARAIADRDIAKVQAAQEKIQGLNSMGEQGESMAKAVDDYQDSRAQQIDNAPPDPELKALRQAHADALEAHSLAQAVADNHRERIDRMIAGDRNAIETKVGDSFHYLLDRDISSNKAELGSLNLANGTRVMAQELGNAIHAVFKDVGDTAANHEQFRAAMENSDFIPQITNPRLRALAINMHSFNAKMAARIPESLKVEIIRDYYPRGAGLNRERFERTIRSDNPLPVSTAHLHERIIPEDQAEVNKAHPADEYESYAASMGQALVNMRVRSTIKDAQTKGKPVFIDFDKVSDRTPPDNGLKYTKSSLAGLDGWLETGTHDRLKSMAQPVGREGIGKSMSAFNSYYKTLAMTSLQHYWNQFSAAIGVDKAGNLPFPGSLVRKGMSITHDPAAFADSLQWNFAQPERFLSEVSDNLTADAPHMAPALDALRAVEKQTFGRFEHALWTSSIRNVQFGIFDALRTNLRAKHGDKYTDEDYNRASGYMGGQITGIQSAKTLRTWERQVQKYLAFAYSWNRKHVTLTAQSLPLVGDKLAQHFDPSLSDKQAHLVQEMSQDYLIRYATTSIGMLTAASIVMGGQPFWMNDKGHEFDINWTKLHDVLFGADGKNHYATFPPMMFANFFHSKAQAFDDAFQRSNGNISQSVIGGLATNFANISMPIPSWFAQTFTNVREEDINDLIGRTYQQANPFQRNFFGPISKEQPPQNLTDILGDVGSFFGGFSGIKTTTGAHHPFNPGQIANQERRGSALILARMGIDPATASDADWAKAQKELHKSDIAGINIGQVAQEIEGRPMGTGSVYKQMNQWADQTMTNALLEAGLTQAQIDKAKADGGQPIHLLTPSQERKMFETHPELQYIMNAPPVSDDPVIIKAHADMTKYNSQLSYEYAKTAGEQNSLDAEYTSGKITLNDWKSRMHDLRQREKGALDLAYKSLTPDEQAKLSRSPNEKASTDLVLVNSPLLREEQAYWDFRQIAAKGNYDQPDGTVSPDLRKAQNEYMANLPADLQQYILNREQQTQTPLQQKYYAAADKYGKFKDQNAQWEEIRSAYDSMPKFQRDLLKETYPDFASYMKYRENYFKENADVADFYHLTDFKAYQQKSKLVQAMDVADWYVTAYGKHPEYNTPWQTSAIKDPNVWAQVTSGWDQQTYQQFISAYQGYYQNQADQRAKFHDYLTQLFARRRAVKVSSGSGNVLGG